MQSCFTSYKKHERLTNVADYMTNETLGQRKIRIKMCFKTTGIIEDM